MGKQTKFYLFDYEKEENQPMNGFRFSSKDFYSPPLSTEKCVKTPREVLHSSPNWNYAKFQI